MLIFNDDNKTRRITKQKARLGSVVTCGDLWSFLMTDYKVTADHETESEVGFCSDLCSFLMTIIRHG